MSDRDKLIEINERLDRLEYRLEAILEAVNNNTRRQQ